MALPRGIRNNNPLNIRKGNNWKGERQPQSDPSFEEFESLQMGLRAGFIILRNYQRISLAPKMRANTIRKIINRWAPPSENNTLKYIDTVARRSGLNPDELIAYRDKPRMLAVVEAMCFVECGQAIDKDVISSAYDLT